MIVTEFERRGAGRGAELRLSVPPDPRQGLIVRREILAFAEQHNILGDDVIDFVAAIGEAVANAIEHAHTNEPIEVAMWLLGKDRLFASVTDKGVGFSPNDRLLDSLLPDAYAERGRGLPIMRRCADIFNIRSAPGQGTHITLGCFIQRAVRGYERQQNVAG
jgi:anti-sigma regulatory factor (Ser/Thr protein kinase)